jgi:hypothetical protein
MLGLQLRLMTLHMLLTINIEQDNIIGDTKYNVQGNFLNSAVQVNPKIQTHIHFKI